MFGKQLTIGKRIGLLAVCMLVLLSVAGALSYSGVGNIVSNAQEVIGGNQLDGSLAQKEVDHLNWAGKVNALLTDPAVTALKVQTDDHQCGFGKWLYGDDRATAERLVPALAPLLKKIEAPHYQLHASAIEIGKLYKPVDENLGNFMREKKIDHLKWMHKVKDAILDPKATSVDVQMDPTQCSLGRWLGSGAVADAARAEPQFGALLKAIATPHERLHASAKGLNARVAEGDRSGAHAAYLAETEPAADATLTAIDGLIAKHQDDMAGLTAAGEVYNTKTVPALAEVRSLLSQIRKVARENILTGEAMLSAALGTRRNVMVVAMLALVCACALSLLISRSITRVLRRLSGGIEEAAEQVGSAAGQVSSASFSLADGASEQAASVEETAASIQEISSQGRDTASLTEGAEALMNENIEKSGQSLKSLMDLTQKLSQIEADSDKIGNIIKTIDEIAFQTNLLALNAAVEAARAGEAGAGFAVVADEVRSLAMRATEAAKSTQTLLDGTLGRIEEASGAIKGINSDFEGIIESATVMGEKTAAITKASGQQAEGLKHIDTAITQIEQVTQQVAATAEESSSASEELTGQAEEMRLMVEEMVALIDGRRQSGAVSGAAAIRSKAPLSARPAPGAGNRKGKDSLPADKDVIPDDETALTEF